MVVSMIRKKCTLGELGYFTKGKGIKKDEISDSGFYCIRYGEIYTKYNTYVEKPFSYISKNIVKSSYKIKTGDILFAGSGEDEFDIGKCVAYLGNEECYAGGDIIIFSPFKDDSLFLSYLLNSKNIKKQMTSMAQGDMVVHIYASHLKNIALEIPLFQQEQKLIANQLFETDQLINSLQSLIQKKKNIKHGAMRELLTGKRRLEGFTGEWEIMPFDKIFLKTATKNFQIKTSEYKDSGKYPIIDQGKEKIAGYTDNEKKVFSCPKNGIIIFGDHTREVKFVNENFVIGADGTQIISTKNSSDIPKFFFYQIKIKNIPNTGYNRHFKFLLEHEFFQPQTEEQKAISDILSEMDSEIQHLETQLDKYINLKQAMMQKLLTGEIRLV